MRPHCIKPRCYSPVACGGFGYCREVNTDWNYRHDIYCVLGSQLLALGVNVTEQQVETLTNAVVKHLHGT